VKIQGKLNKYIIFESVTMLLTKNYQNWPMLVETTAFQIWRVSDTQCRMVWLYPTVKNLKIVFIRFDRIHERDRRTDRHTPTLQSKASRGKLCHILMYCGARVVI